MEQGVSTFRYTLFPFTTRADAKRRADEFNLAPKPLHDTYHKGTLADEFRGFEADSGNIVVTAVKRGEDGGKVLRFVELDGKDAKVGVGLFWREDRDRNEGSRGSHYRGWARSRPYRVVNR